MKKKVLVFILLTFFVVFIAIDYKPKIIEDKPDAYKAVQYINNDLSDYPNGINDFYLLFDNYKLDSKNFVQVLSFFEKYDYKILEIYPYINPLYQDLLNKIYRISYNGKSLSDGLSQIYNVYMNELDRYHLTEEIDKVLVNGIRIRMIKINLNNEVLKVFLGKYKSVKYSLTHDGLFSTF